MKGIQPGTIAADAHSKKLDAQCKKLQNKVFELLHRNYDDTFILQKKLRKNQIPGNKGACEPDGGLWFYKGILIATFEGKKQQDRGNAIERWYKNNAICRLISPNISYVTFACGEGAYDDGRIGDTLNVFHLLGFNKYNPGNNSCFMIVEGFDIEYISDIMIEVIEERIYNINKNG